MISALNSELLARFLYNMQAYLTPIKGDFFFIQLGD